MEKKYWWIKLTCDFYRKPAIDFLRRQENGNTYVVIYLILCMETSNNNGILAQQIGEIIAPFTDHDVARLTNENIDVVRKAMELYVKLGLIYERNSDGYLQIRDVADMVGYTSDNAKRLKEWREKKKKTLLSMSNDISNDISNEMSNEMSNDTQEYRDKSIEKEIELEKELEKKPSNRKRFTPPTIEDVQSYANEKGYSEFDAEKFWCYYDSKGWMVGKNKMSNWKSAVTGWHKREEEKKPKKDSWVLNDLPF